jgi:hypothetical protein
MAERGTDSTPGFAALRAAAELRFGPQRAEELRAPLLRLAAALEAVASYPLPPSTEPFAPESGERDNGVRS